MALGYPEPHCAHDFWFRGLRFSALGGLEFRVVRFGVEVV